MSRNRPCPGEYRFASVQCLIHVRSEIEEKGTKSPESRYYISSRSLSAEDALRAGRAHWGIENKLHWVVDVTFKDDISRLRKGHGAKNMAVVRHFAFNLIRRAKDKYSLKRRRKLAGWSPDYLASLFVNPDS